MAKSADGSSSEGAVCSESDRGRAPRIGAACCELSVSKDRFWSSILQRYSDLWGGHQQLRMPLDGHPGRDAFAVTVVIGGHALQVHVPYVATDEIWTCVVCSILLMVLELSRKSSSNVELPRGGRLQIS